MSPSSSPRAPDVPESVDPLHEEDTANADLNPSSPIDTDGGSPTSTPVPPEPEPEHEPAATTVAPIVAESAPSSAVDTDVNVDDSGASRPPSSPTTELPTPTTQDPEPEPPSSTSTVPDQAPAVAAASATTPPPSATGTGVTPAKKPHPYDFPNLREYNKANDAYLRSLPVKVYIADHPPPRRILPPNVAFITPKQAAREHEDAVAGAVAAFRAVADSCGRVATPPPVSRHALDLPCLPPDVYPAPTPTGALGPCQPEDVAVWNLMARVYDPRRVTENGYPLIASVPASLRCLLPAPDAFFNHLLPTGDTRLHFPRASFCYLRWKEKLVYIRVRAYTNTMRTPAGRRRFNGAGRLLSEVKQMFVKPDDRSVPGVCALACDGSIRGGDDIDPSHPPIHGYAPRFQAFPLLPFVDLAERGGDPVVHFLGPLSMMGAVSAVEPPPRRENADAWALLPAAARWGFRLQPDGRCVDGFRVGYFAGPTAASNLGAIVFYAGTDDDDAPTPHPALLPRGRLNLPTDASVVVNLLGLGESIRPEERAAMQTVLNERHAAAYTSPEVALALTFNLVHCGLAATGFYGTNLHSTPFGLSVAASGNRRSAAGHDGNDRTKQTFREAHELRNIRPTDPPR
jgi:hypothetical protein